MTGIVRFPFVLARAGRVNLALASLGAVVLAVFLPGKKLEDSPPPSSSGERPAGAALVVQGALEQTRVTRFYDPSYVALAYPGGDVPQDRGVCADVVVRAYRRAGLDLQRAVHEDMTRAFPAYPRRWRWGLARPDASIDHRRVANLMKFFSRRGDDAPRGADFLPGDVVAWDLGGGKLHTGVVVSRAGEGRARIVHNIGAGARAEDVLSSWPIVGHYRSFR